MSLPDEKKLDEWAAWLTASTVFWKGAPAMDECVAFLRSPELREAMRTQEAVRWLEAQPTGHAQRVMAGRTDPPYWYASVLIRGGVERVDAGGKTFPEAVEALRSRLSHEGTSEEET